MPGSDAQQGDRWAFWMPPALFPVPEGVDADTHGESELRLRETYETPQGRNVFARFNLSEHEALSDACRDGPGELFFGQLWDFSHDLSSM
jgi:hypothetical protein